MVKVCQYPGDPILYMEDKQTVHLTKKIMKCLKIYLICGYQILGMQILLFFQNTPYLNRIFVKKTSIQI